MKSNYFSCVGIFIWCGLLLVSCSTLNPTLPHDSSPISVPLVGLDNPTIQPTQQFSGTLLPPATSPPALIPTSVPLSTGTVTPLPTLLPLEAESLISDLYQDNGNCLLPCFWSFVPGETQWPTIEQFMTTIAYQIYPDDLDSESFIAEVYLYLPQLSSVPINHMYGVEDGTITMIEADLLMMPNTVLQSVLKTYGQPTEVWLLTASVPMDDFLGFFLTLFYAERHFLLTYSGQGTVIEGKVRGCLSGQTESLQLVSWSPEKELTFVEAWDGLHKPRPIIYNLPLEEATTMSVDVFYETFKNTVEPVCLETPTELWPGP